MTVQLRPVPLGHTPARPPEWPRHVVAINDVSVVKGGATGIALLSAGEIARHGVKVTLLTGDAGEGAADLPEGVSLAAAGSRHVRSGSRASAMLRGLYNSRAHDFVADWIRANDEPGTIYHLHGWSKILSPAVFRALRPVQDRLVLSAHDFFLACPNGGYFDFRKERACSLKPMSVACLSTNCDRRAYHEKVWRGARHGLLQAFAGLGEDGPPVLAVHDGMVPHLARGGIREDRLRGFRNPVTPWHAQRVPAEENRRFLFVGRLEEDKGVLLAAQAAQAAGVELAIVGGGPLAERLAREYPGVRLHGWQDRQGIARVASGARAVVMPTRYREAFGLVAVEALGSGLPLVIADHAMIAPEVEAGGMGIACDPHDVDALAAILRRLDGDDAAIRDMSLRAHAGAGRLAPTTEEWTLSLLDTYAEVLQRARPVESRRTH